MRKAKVNKSIFKTKLFVIRTKHSTGEPYFKEETRGIASSFRSLMVVLSTSLITMSGCTAADAPKNATTSIDVAESEHYWNFPDIPEATKTSESNLRFIEVADALSVRKTQYRIRVPENWNGTLISDLDYHRAADSPKYMHLLNQGYAMSGTLRRPDRLTNYDPASEIHDLISVLDVFESKFGKPKRTIQYGCSGGGNVATGMAELHPNRIDGSITAGSPTSPWFASSHLDGFFVLKALVAPDLPIVDLPLKGDEIKMIGSEWKLAVDEAQKTPEGRARIALAVTIGQWPGWGGTFGENTEANAPEPDPNDAYAIQKSMYNVVSLLLPSEATFGHSMLEQAAPGQLRSNTGVDYIRFFENGEEPYRNAVKELYKAAKLDLNSDLKKINDFPRIASDPEAIKWWSAPGRTHVGEPKIPLLRMHTNGDLLVNASMVTGYQELVSRKGYSDLFRTAFVKRAGHCTFNLAEFTAAIETMNRRLDTGAWPSTEPQAMNALGASLVSENEPNFFNYRGVKKYNRVWLPTAQNFVGE